MKSELLAKVYNGQSLNREESSAALNEILSGEWSDFQIAAFLTALHVKKETAEELAGFASAMTEKSVPVNLAGVEAIDTCGTGGDRRGTFNISTITAFVLAGAGVPVAKHGNRASSSQCGSADLLAALGIRYRMQPDEIPAALEMCRFAFLFAPDYHPATKTVAGIRRQLGLPTIFNLLGPLTNPARPRFQLIGVYSQSAAPLVAGALSQMDTEKRFAVLHGNGWDEATLHDAFELHDGKDMKIHRAADFGFVEAAEEEIRGGAAPDNAAICMSILRGEKSARRDTVLLNALLAYRIFRPKTGLSEARALLEESIDSGNALRIVSVLQKNFPGGAE